MSEQPEIARTEEHERVADEHVRRLLDGYVSLSGAVMTELAPNLHQLVIPASDRRAFGRRSVARIAFSVEAMQEDEHAEMAIIGSPFAAQLIEAVRRRGDRHFVGRVTPTDRDLSSAPPAPVPIRNGQVAASSASVRRHRVGSLIARVVVRAGADVREHLAESALFDLSSGALLTDDVARACVSAGDASALANRSDVWESLAVSGVLPMTDMVPRMLDSLEASLRPEIEKLETESQRALTHELGRIERYYRSLLDDLGGRGSEITDARAAYHAEHSRRKREETDRHEVRAIVHPVQLQEFELLVQRAEWAIEGGTGRRGTLVAQRSLAGNGAWVLRCPTCSGPLREGVICRSDHLACDLCSLDCSVCRDSFCRGHGLAACHIDALPVCSEHSRTCVSCHRAHCSAHDGLCDESGHAACAACLADCAFCGRIVCDRHATLSDPSAPKGARRLCSNCVRACEGGVGEVVGPDEVTGCASCEHVVCERHQARCDVDKRIHCSKHLRRTDRSRRLVCEKDRARCAHEPNAIVAVDEVVTCATCSTITCSTHSAICVVDGLTHCLTHLAPVKDRPRASACVRHQSRCHIDDVVYTSSGTASCPCCGKATCVDHRRECDNCGRAVCTKDYSSGATRACATCRRLVEVTDVPDDILEAAMLARDGDSSRPKRWRMTRDSKHRIVELDLGWTRRLVVSVPHATVSPDTVVSHSILGRRILRPST